MLDLRSGNKRYDEILEKYGDIEAHIYANMSKTDRAKYASVVAMANRQKRDALKPSQWLEVKELMPFADIGKALGIRPEVARNIYVRALEKLRKASTHTEFAIEIF